MSESVSGVAGILIGLLLLAGALLVLVGALGLVFTRDIFDRIHAHAIGTITPIVLVVVASGLAGWSLDIVHGGSGWVLVGLFALVSPMSTLYLARAALYRMRGGDSKERDSKERDTQSAHTAVQSAGQQPPGKIGD